MKRIAYILLCLMLACPAVGYAQKRTTAGKKTVIVKKTRKKTTTTKQQPATVESLQNQRQRIQQQIKEQQQRLASNQKDVKNRLRNLMILNTEIEGKRRTIESIRRELDTLDVVIEEMTIQLEQLQQELAACKERYVKSLRYMHRNRTSQSQLMFIFSADNLSQMFRRMRFMREYAAYQHVQGDEVKSQQESVDRQLKEITEAKMQKESLLAKGEREQRSLESKKTEQQNVVRSLQKEQKTIQGIIAQQQKKDAALNAQIDRLIAEEVARQKARAAAEAKRRAEAEAARKRQAELARKKAAAEAAARENARRIAEAREREEKARREAEAAKNAKDREAAERKAREAKERLRAEEARAEADAREHAKEVASARKEAEAVLKAPSEDQRITGSFESNRGRLPMPITGSYKIVSHFGQYNVEGLKNVKLDNKGINILGQPGSSARSIFDGEVSAVFNWGGQLVVMVRHGEYISVYCNLKSVHVKKGQKVTTRQVLGTVGQDNILQFQLRKETAKLNPEVWLGR